jgi:hypothetical protein
MDDKTSGIDFDRHVFVQSQPATARPTAPIGGILLAVVLIALMVFAAVKLFPQFGRSSDADTPSEQALTNIDQRLSGIEQRLERLETARRMAPAAAAEKPSQSNGTPAANQSARTIYRISPTPTQPARPASSAAADPAVAQRLSSIQRGLGALQSDETENHDAWQATTNRLADVAGQVGSQGVQILRSQDELNELIGRTEVESIPFELKRGSDPVQVGPVSFVLKSVDAKQQRYTLCIYLEPSCVQLKNRVLYEVAQFVATRNSRPLEVVATKITKDGLVGYLEVPKVNPVSK